MQTYLAFLRGVNVGGKAIIKMSDLQIALMESKLQNVRTFIQSGNVIFSTNVKAKKSLAKTIKSTIQNKFKISIDVAIFTDEEWHDVMKFAPKWWGKDKAWKHNLLIMIEPYDMPKTLTAIGELKPGIENMVVGKGVIYQSLLLQKFGQTSGTKLVGTPYYKRMTIRNYNTSTKLLNLLS